MNKVTCAETVTIRTWLPKFSVLILFPNFPFFFFFICLGLYLSDFFHQIHLHTWTRNMII